MTEDARRLRTPPSRGVVLDAVARLGPVTLLELRAELRVPWRDRTALRNHVAELVAEGRVIEDDSDPVRVTARKETP